MIDGIAAFLALGVLILEQGSGSTFLKKDKATVTAWLTMHEWMKEGANKQTTNESALSFFGIFNSLLYGEADKFNEHPRR